MTTTAHRLLAIVSAVFALSIGCASAAGAQGAITCGETVSGTISPVGDADTWTFAANTGDAIIVRIGEITQSGSFSPRVRLFSPSSTLLATSSSAVAAEVAATAASSGTYSVIVDDAAGAATGTYRITLVRTGTAVTVSAGDEGGPLTNGAVQTGTIDVGDLDVWTVTANAGDAIVARMGETVAGSALTPQLRLYGPTGTLVSNSASAAAAEVSGTASVSGTYLVVAGDLTSGWTGSGSYRLTLAQSGTAVTVSPGDEGGPLTNGAVQTGTIDVGDLDVWTVTANAGDAIIVRMGETVAGGALTPQLRLYGPTGTLVSNSANAAAAEVSGTASVSGTYLVVAGDLTSGWTGSGSYRLTLAQSGTAVTVSPGDEGGPLTNGAVQTGTIDVGDLDLWTVTASAGDAIIVRMGETVAGGALTPQLRLYGPTGTLVSNSSGAAAAEVTGTASVSGTYLVVAGDLTSGWTGSGSYRLTLAKTGSPVTVSDGDEGGPMTNGWMHTGVIDVGDLDLWTVSANAGDAIIVRMGETVASSALTPQLRLYGPTGTLISNSSGAAAAEVTGTANVSGTYLVVAGDVTSGWTGSGSYRLTLARSGTTAWVSPGDEGGRLVPSPSCTIDVGDLDVWTVPAIAGDSVVVRMEEIVTGSALTPQLRLYNPTGSLVASGSNASAVQIAVRAAATGTYMLVAGDVTSGWTGSGLYRLALTPLLGVDDAPRSLELAIAAGTPDPFTTRTMLRYQVPRAGRVSLALYDAQGRVVRRLVDELASRAGAFDVVWDGRDDAGIRLRPGLYLARIDAGGHSRSRKLTLAR